MRERRLQSDWERMKQLGELSSLIEIDFVGGDPPERYLVTFRCQGLLWLPGTPAPAVSSQHQCELYLHLQYPRTPPRITWMTEIYHPNILPPRQNGGVCIGDWTPAETLDQLCIRVGEMVQMKNYNLNDPLNPEAAAWVQANRDKFPLDLRPLVRPEQEPDIELA